uniref:Uncharacterized protein n=1 Tax=viral metagenome TaxID=1070528 RepID=A0A6M3MFW8_9ZZZZ
MKILLGFEVGTGKEVYFGDGQSVVTGMTQLSGKTTTLEALVERGKVTAVAFLTKRGESGFRNQREIPPYFKEQKRGTIIDWQYVEAILEATMGEKMKIERSFIIDCCNGMPKKKNKEAIPPARSLEDVYNNFKAAQKDATRGLDQSIYTNLAAYFEIILPQIKKYSFSNTLELREGFNVLNLIGMEEEMQQLVIESVLSYVYEKMRNVIIVIPEAHKFIPQGLKTPVKGTALRLIKEGAGIGNYMWIDTQETTSTDKALLKQCSNWIMGYQQEKNEVKNVRENLGLKKISSEDIMNLRLGHFMASLNRKIYHVYVLPSGIDPEVGRAVAMGKISVEDVKQTLMLEKGEYVAREQEARVEFKPRKIEAVEAGQNLDKLLIELNDANERALELEGKLHRLEVGRSDEKLELEMRIEDLQRDVDTLGVRTQALQDEVNELTVKAEGIVARNKQLEEELSQFTAFKILLASIISPQLEFPQVSDEELEKIRKDIAELKRPVATRRRASPEGDTGIAWIDIWLPKLGSAEAKILRFMAEKFPLKMTRSQIAIGIGLTAKGGHFSGSFNNLVKNRLIVKDGNNYSLAEGPP